MIGEGRGCKDAPCMIKARPHHPYVIRVGKKIVADRRRFLGITAFGQNRPPAARSRRAHGHGHAGWAVKDQGLAKDIAGRGEQKLQIRIIQIIPAFAEHRGTGDPHGQGASARRDKFQKFSRKARKPSQLVQGDDISHPRNQTHGVVV